MIKIRAVKASDLETIQKIARATWPVAYGNILPQAQIEFMLELFYSISNLDHDIVNGHKFLIAENESGACGFCAYQHIIDDKSISTKIHKLYILPVFQGLGTGKYLVSEVESAALQVSSNAVFLNVNRHNSAIDFYKKIGFEIAFEEDIAIGRGYFMNDYVMRKQLRII